MATLDGLTLEQAVYRLDAIYRQPEWTYDTTLGRYRNATTGRFLSEADALRLTRRTIAQADQQLQELMQQLDQQVITLPQWQRQVAALIKRLHLAQYILGRGGIRQTTPADFLEVARILKAEYRYLDGFARDLAAGRLSLAQASARARLYLAKTRLSYWSGQRRAQDQGPMPTEMRRLLAPVDHCRECVLYAQAGWVPLGALPLPTVDCTCRSNCRCTVQYR